MNDSDVDQTAKNSSSNLSDSGSSIMYKREIGIPQNFVIPKSWRGDIMKCINSKEMTPKARNALVRDLVVHMYSYTSRPSKKFCDYAARRLTISYPFMRDALGNGCVSNIIIEFIRRFLHLLCIILGFLGEAYH